MAQPHNDAKLLDMVPLVDKECQRLFCRRAVWYIGVMPVPGSRGGTKGLTEPYSANTEKEMSCGKATREILESSRIG